jgi:hypothetical protein
MGPIGSAETSVSNYLTPRNNPEDRRIQFSRGSGLQSRQVIFFFTIGFLYRNFYSAKRLTANALRTSRTAYTTTLQERISEQFIPNLSPEHFNFQELH